MNKRLLMGSVAGLLLVAALLVIRSMDRVDRKGKNTISHHQAEDTALLPRSLPKNSPQESAGTIQDSGTTSSESDAQAIMDRVLRTPANDSRIKRAVETGLINEEIANILWGKEFDPQILARNLDAIMALVQNPDADQLLIRYAVAAMGIYRGTRALDFLMGLATQSEGWKKKSAFYALSSWLPDNGSISDVLLRELATSGSPLRYAAMEVLVEKDVQIPVNVFLQVAQEIRGITAYYALNALAEQWGTKALPCLKHIAENSDSEGLRGHAQGIYDKLSTSGSYSTARSANGGGFTIRLTTGDQTQTVEMGRIDWPPSPRK